jgi:hypothetical protein
MSGHCAPGPAAPPATPADRHAVARVVERWALADTAAKSCPLLTPQVKAIKFGGAAACLRFRGWARHPQHVTSMIIDGDLASVTTQDRARNIYFYELRRSRHHWRIDDYQDAY